MKRVVLLLALLLCGAAQAQVGQIPNWPPATFVAAAAGYTGPCDIVTCTVAFGLRAPSAATRGNRLVNVCDITGGTVNGSCVDLVSDATTGLLVPQTGIGTNSVSCPGANCGIKKYYAVIGTTACAGSTPCDVVQATATSMHTLGTSCSPTTKSVCATSTGGFYLSATGAPFSNTSDFMAAVANITFTGATQPLLGDSSGTHQFVNLNHGGASTAITCDGGTFEFDAGGAGGYHAVAGFCNGSSDFTVIDNGTPATGTTLIVNNNSGFVALGGQGGDVIVTGGIFLEGQIAAAVTVSSSSAITLNGNAKTFWGF